MSPLVDLPTVVVAETTILRLSTPSGMFASRVMSTIGLLMPTDLSGGTFTAEERYRALEQFLHVKRPSTALALFWCIVALEDLIRDVGDRLATIPDVHREFPNISRVALVQLESNRSSGRPDRDAFSYLAVGKVNEAYKAALGIEPLAEARSDWLHDLALLRHTVAHHGALIRSQDVPRFRYFRVHPGHFINPPIEFVRETVQELCDVGLSFERAVRDVVVDHFAALARPFDVDARPEPLVALIELFDYFRLLPVEAEQPNPSVMSTQESIRREISRVGDANREALLVRCLAELREQRASPAS